MLIYRSVNGLKKIQILCFLMLSSIFMYGQGPSLSPHDLKESFLEKRTSFRKTFTKKIAADKQLELDNIVVLLEENAPNSFEFHFVKYINGNYDLSLKEHLFEAYRLKPDALEVRKEMFAYYVLIGDKSSQRKYGKGLINSYSDNVQNYYKNMVANPEIHTLFLSGNGDAFPLMILQHAGLIRNDINLISLDFLKNETYRKRIQTQIGMSNVNFNTNESMFIPTALSVLQSQGFIATTVSQRYFSEPAQGCYLTGLNYQYNATNQKEQLEAFWINAQASLTGINLESRYEKSLYSNYLPPLLTLYKLKLGEGNKDDVLKKGILMLAKTLGKEEMVNGILKGYDQTE